MPAFVNSVIVAIAICIIAIVAYVWYFRKRRQDFLREVLELRPRLPIHRLPDGYTLNTTSVDVLFNELWDNADLRHFTPHRSVRCHMPWLSLDGYSPLVLEREDPEHPGHEERYGLKFSMDIVGHPIIVLWSINGDDMAIASRGDSAYYRVASTDHNPTRWTQVLRAAYQLIHKRPEDS